MRKLLNSPLVVVYEMLESSMAPVPGQTLLFYKMVAIRARSPETGRRLVGVILDGAKRP